MIAFGISNWTDTVKNGADRLSWDKLGLNLQFITRACAQTGLMSFWLVVIGFFSELKY